MVFGTARRHIGTDLKLMPSYTIVSELRFWKVQSVGNDFVLVCENDLLDYAKLAQQVSQRRFSIGSDGLLVVAKISESRIRLRMFNPDGTEDFCGNGMRCAGAFAKMQGWVNSNFIIEHHGNDVEASIDDNSLVRTISAPASFDPAVIPLARGTAPLMFEKLRVAGYDEMASAVSTGSTHTVLQCDALPNDEEFFAVGPALEHDPIFPERTSVIWAHQVDDTTLKIRIWERGAGETLGCGTGSMAAAAVFLKREERGGKMVVANPGGDVTVEMKSAESPIVSSARAEILFTGTICFSNGLSTAAVECMDTMPATETGTHRQLV